MENVNEGLQVYLKKKPLQMFLERLLERFKKIGGAYENSNIFYKVFYGDTETFE